MLVAATSPGAGPVGTRAVPCVAVTAFAGNQDRQRALDAGFDAYISKPFRHKELVDLVRGLVRGDGNGE